MCLINGGEGEAHQVLRNFVPNYQIQRFDLSKYLAECVPVTGTSIIYLFSFLKVKSFLLLIYFFVLGKSNTLWANGQVSR